MSEGNVIPFQTREQTQGIRHVLVRDSSTDLEVVHVFGDIDLSGANELESMLVTLSSQDHAPSLIVDLSACHYLDSTILTVFVKAARQLDERFALVVPPGNPVRRILRIVALEKFVHTEDTLETAAHALGVTLPTP